MSSKRKYQPRKLKFSGEESFIVNDGRDRKFLMMTADPTIGKTVSPDILVPTDETVKTPVTRPIVVPEPPVILTFPMWETLSCDQIQVEIQNLQNILTTSRFTEDIRAQYESQIALGRKTYDNKCGKVDLPPAPPVIEEPKWGTLSCTQVKNEIANLESILSNSPTDSESSDRIRQYIQNGKNYYDTNCKVTIEPPPPPPGPGTTTITTTGTPIIATSGSGLISSGAFARGGGGGGGAAQPVEPEKKKGFQWWWLLVIAGGLYLISRKTKK